MEFLRTPDERFENLSGYNFRPSYLQVDDTEGGELRVHFIDEGSKEAPLVLLMHGEPSWSFLYRHMAPVIVDAGYRVIAPDLIGFGRSDKPTARSDYTYQRHVDWMRSVLVALDLQDVTLVCQDWGGLIGLRLLAEHSDRFARAVAANTFLPTGDHKAGEAFLQWQKFSQEVPVFPTSKVIAKGVTSELTENVLAGYDAPYPDEAYKAGARQFPMLVPITPDNPASQKNREAWEVLSKFDKPFLTAFSDKDPITAGADKIFQKLIPGTQGQPHTIIKDGGHFLQEDKGPELAQVVVDFIRATQ